MYSCYPSLHGPVKGLDWQVLEHFSPAAVRFYLLSAHYRHPLDYSKVALEEAKSANMPRDTIEKAIAKGTGEARITSAPTTSTTAPTTRPGDSIRRRSRTGCRA